MALEAGYHREISHTFIRHNTSGEATGSKIGVVAATVILLLALPTCYGILPIVIRSLEYTFLLSLWATFATMLQQFPTISKSSSTGGKL